MIADPTLQECADLCELNAARARIAGFIEAMGDGWVAPIDEESGARWDACGNWQIRLANRPDQNGWVTDALGYVPSWAIKAIRTGTVTNFVSRLRAPYYVIEELFRDAMAFVVALSLSGVRDVD